MGRYTALKIVPIISLLLSTSAMSAPDFSLIGFASTNGGTTGGGNGKAVSISSLSALESWAKSREKNTTPEVVTISGKISGSTMVTIKNGANITIQGSGTSGELAGVGLNIRDYKNVIVKNLKIHEVKYPNDGLTLDNVQQGWVDHCELYSKMGDGITNDTYDGLLDVKKGSAGITISWCYLHDHMKCNLMGHTDDASQSAEDSKIRVTQHHNYFYNTKSRNPSLRHGAAHLFNNYYGKIDDYGIASRLGAHVKVENCYYEDVKLPMATDKFDGDKGYICESGNIFPGCGKNSITQTGCDWWSKSNLPYSYKLDDVKDVKSIVQQYAGVKGGTVAIQQSALPSRSLVSSSSLVSVHVTSKGSLLPFGERYDLKGKLLSPVSGKKLHSNAGIVLVRQTPVQR